MEWFEVIHIRLFSKKEKNPAESAFFQLVFPNFRGELKSVRLLQDVLLENDLRIVIHWNGRITQKAKSVLGTHLAAAFADFGSIHHSVCRECLMPERSIS